MFGNSFSSFIVIFLFMSMYSCVDNKLDANVEEQVNLIEYVNCVYESDRPELKDLDSLALIFNFGKIDSLYKIKETFDKNDQIFLSILKSKAYFKSRNYESHEILIGELDSLFRENFDYHELLFPSFLVEKARYFMVNQIIDSTTTYVNKAIELYNEFKYETCAQKVSSLSVMAVAQAYYGGEIAEANKYLKEIESLLDNSTGAEKSRFRNYYSLASINRRLKKESLALNYANLAIAELLKSESIDTSNLAISYSLRANVYYGFLNIDEAISDFKKATFYGEMGNLSAAYMNIFYTGIVNCYTNINDLENSLIYIDKLKQIKTGDNNILGLYYKTKANILLNGNIQLSTSIEQFNKAIKYLETAKNPNLHQLMESYFLLSLALTYTRRFNEAFIASEKSLMKLITQGEFDFKTLSKDPISIRYLTNHFIIIKKLFEESNNKKYKLELKRLSILINEIIEFYDKEIDEDVILNNQIYLEKYYFHYFEYCNNERIESNSNEGFDNVLNIFTQYKSKSLQRNTFMYLSKWEIEYPLLFDKYRKNRSSIEELKHKMHNNIGDIDSINLLYHKLLTEEAALNDSLELINYHSKGSFGITNDLLKNVENYCRDENTIIIDYFISQNIMWDSIVVSDVGYVFVSNGIKSDIITIPNVKSIIEDVSWIKSSVKEEADINKVSNSVYNKLLFFLDEYRIGKEQAIIIIPDNKLRSLPFEILKSDDNSYLIEQFPVSYGFSIGSIIKEDKEFNGVDKNEILLFSHSSKKTILNQSSNKLSELPGSYKEFKLVNSIFKSSCKSFAGLESTKSNFFKFAPEYPIIHLALHGEADLNSRHNSRIFFRTKDSIESLYPFELINKKIHPQLLILSACESGYGRLYNQEGMYSIARAFYLAGTKNIISSLWELDDDASFDILSYFYEEIEGKHFSTYRKALQKAKIKYLLKHKSLEQVSFKLWAGLIIYH